MNNKTKLGITNFIGIILLLIANSSLADVETEMPLAYEEHGFHDWREEVASGADHIDPFSGSLNRSYIDLVLPGNGGMDIKIQRSYNSNIWYSRGPKTYSDPPFPSYLFPRSPSGIGWTMHFGRILKAGDQGNQNDSICYRVVDSILNNPVLELQDGSRHVMLVWYANQQNYKTKNHWFADCNVDGSGLIVYSPDGYVYTMDYLVNPHVSDGYTTKTQRAWYPTKIEDRYGNYFTITYHSNPLNTHALIDTITAYDSGSTVTDGRKVVFSYNADSTIKSITSYSNSTLLQTVNYSYEPVGAVGHVQLSSVTLPDGRSWSYEYCPSSTTANCAPDAMQKVTTPYGATTIYEYGWADFNGTLLQEGPGTTNYYSWVVTKRINGGISIPETVWQYDYFPGQETTIEPGFDNDYTEVTFPGGKYIYKHYGIQRQLSFTGYSPSREIWKTGRLIEKEIYDIDDQLNYILKQREKYTWHYGGFSSYENDYAIGYYNTGTTESMYFYDDYVYTPNLIKKTILRDGTIYTSEYDHTLDEVYNIYPFRPRNIIEYSKLGETTLSYRSHDISWYPFNIPVTKFFLFYQKLNEFYPDYDTFLLNEEKYRPLSKLRWFDTTKGILDAEQIHGQYTSYEYYPTGDLYTKTDANINTITYNNYFRGIPQNEIYQESVTKSRTVNTTGTIQQETNGRGKVTVYDYDSMNRLSFVDLPKPLNDSANIDIIWSATENTKTVSRNNYEQITQLDGLKRPVCIQTKDTTNNIIILKIIRYDALGRKIFESYPFEGSTCPSWVDGIPAGIDGTVFEYDVLGRVTTITHSDGKSKTVRYLPGNKKEVIDEDGYVTYYTYRSFGDPDSSQDTHLVRIDAPNSISTIIDRDVTGRPNWVRQEKSSTGAGHTRTYTYKPFTGYLESIDDPETGLTTFGRDGVGNMTSKNVSGSGETTYYCYDGLNRLKRVDYQDPNTPDVAYIYDGNNNVTDVYTGVNAAGGCSGTLFGFGGTIWANWEYIYDDNDNLTNEIVNVLLDGVTHQTAYIYNNLDHVSAVRYPSFATTSHQVDYNPDAFGRPTQALPYVTDVGYYAGGQTKFMQYENGIRTDFGLDGRHRINDINTTGGVSSLFYNYDGRSNPTRIRDRRDAQYTRNMSYDGLNRLTAAGGYWGTKSVDTIKYDETGNIKSKKLGTSMDLIYSYDANNRLDTVTGTSNYSFTYDAHGNVTGNSKNHFVYDKANNLIEVNTATGIPLWDDLYDGNNRRIRRLTSAGAPTYYFYTKNSQLLGEYDGASRIKEYVYLGDKLVAAFKSDNNVLPIAIASVNQTSANEGATVTLDGTLSSGTITGYSWGQQGQYAATMQSPDSVTTSVVLPRVRTNTVVTFTLSVVDDNGNIATTSVSVTVINTSNDDDGDGMDDIWEESNFPTMDIANILPTADADGDGASNLQEFNQQSDPNNPVASVPRNVRANLKLPDLEITWNPVIEATSYNIYWSNTPGVTKANGTKIANATSPYVHTGLDTTKTYYYVVTAENVFGESAESAEVQARPDISWLIPIINMILE